MNNESIKKSENPFVMFAVGLLAIMALLVMYYFHENTADLRLQLALTAGCLVAACGVGISFGTLYNIFRG